MLREIVADCRRLSDNQFYARLNAAILLGNAYVVAEVPADRIAAEFYTPAFEALLEVLEKPGQPEAIKLVAVNGLRNAAVHSNPPLEPSQRIRLANKLRDELAKTDTNEWYQERICETLGSLDQILDLDGKPFIVHALAKALFDRTRPLCARAAAARALGRDQLPPDIDLNVVAYGIADLARQIAETRNEGKKQVRRWCIIKVLLAFVPRDSAERRARRLAGTGRRADLRQVQGIGEGGLWPGPPLGRAGVERGEFSLLATGGQPHRGMAQGPCSGPDASCSRHASSRHDPGDQNRASQGRSVSLIGLCQVECR